jgi:hypothetical protein
MLLTFGQGGCALRRGEGIQVIPKSSSGGVLQLSADDVVAVMRRAGFTNEQIWEHGTAVRDGLAQAGAVFIKVNNKIEAMFVVKDENIQIYTLSRGYFVYNINSGWQRVEGNLPPQ